MTPVRWRSRTQVNEYLPLSRRDPTRFEGAALAWQRGLEAAQVSLGDLGFVETHDCFTVAELLEYEAMGLAPHGQGARVILDGVTRRDGKLPVNLSGGLKSRGHPIGATGVSQHVMAAMQLSGSAGEMQTRQSACRRGVQHGGRLGRQLPERAGGGVNPAQCANLSVLLAQTAALFPDRPGLIQGERRWSWHEIDARVDALVEGLRSLGMQAGDKLLVQSRNSLALFESAGRRSGWARSGCRPISD